MSNRSQLYFIRGAADTAEALDYFCPRDAAYPAGTPAVPVGVNNHPLVSFPQAVVSYVDFSGVLPPSGIVRLLIYWAATVAAGDVLWGAAWERDDADGGVDLDINSFDTAKTVTSTAPVNVGELRVAQIDFTPDEMGGVQPGEPYRLRVSRSGGVAPDNMAGNAQLFRVILTEP